MPAAPTPELPELYEALMTTRSMRRFTAAPVPDEVVDEVLGLWRQLRSATGQPRFTEGGPIPLGRCDCGGRLVSDGQAEPLPQCGTCMRRFATLTVKQAAERLGCTERVIYRRIALGQIERTGRGQVDVRSLMRWREGRLSSDGLRS